jgi:hypothetical protein
MILSFPLLAEPVEAGRESRNINNFLNFFFQGDNDNMSFSKRSKSFPRNIHRKDLWTINNLIKRRLLPL